MWRRRVFVRLSAIVALVSGTAVAPQAQNERFLGIWELNLPKSSITRGAAPRREMIVNVVEPNGFRSVLSVVTERGTSVEIHHYNTTVDRQRLPATTRSVRL